MQGLLAGQGPKPDFETLDVAGSSANDGDEQLLDLPPTDLSLQHEWGLRWVYGMNNCSHAAIFVFAA